MEYFVNVILPIPLERHFTYSIKADQAKMIEPGMRVAVPFGKSRIYTALILEIHQNPPVAHEAKPIHQILDDVPLVNPVQLDHWKWIPDYYMCTLGVVFRTAVPGALLLESETIILKNQEVERDDA